ncbi:helix-turn-helix transcriptional regulator [Pseudidiomarina woesei]|uniref:DNA-binding transcriptional regulator, XRE-family HTH domain n=1 Tax=Pseudidiomarina woesei TaxID=1381080 RepID=A0A0K6H7D6_9GAMM|nr:helix-turn-helix domain-containing protein [Pseudidiomarina woesei]CUA86637.1 DNA-binding transcriptional regulator, XRE-family HTH domain [Pseudidiomarina woesei]
MQLSHLSPAALAEELGQRLKQARLNANITQAELAKRAGVSRKIVLSAEKGQVQLENFAALLLALGLAEQLNNFIPKPQISPIQLQKLQGKKRERASGRRASSSQPSGKTDEGEPSW